MTGRKRKPAYTQYDAAMEVLNIALSPSRPVDSLIGAAHELATLRAERAARPRLVRHLPTSEHENNLLTEAALAWCAEHYNTEDPSADTLVEGVIAVLTGRQGPYHAAGSRPTGTGCICPTGRGFLCRATVHAHEVGRSG